MTDDQQELLSRLAEDPEFRSDLRQDPEGALARRGVELSEEQRANLRELDLNVPDEQLAERVSKRVAAFSGRRAKRRIRGLGEREGGKRMAGGQQGVVVGVGE